MEEQKHCGDLMTHPAGEGRSTAGSGMIEIRLGTEADKGQILERMEEVYGAASARSAERLWHWQWHLDPRLAAPGYRGVVAEWRGRIIANLATIPAGLLIEDRPTQAWWFVDVLTHWGLTRQALREHKRAGAAAGGPDLSAGIAAALFDHPAAGPIQLGKHISDPMAKIGRRLGFVPVPQTGGRHRRISTRYALGRALGTTLGDLTGAVVDLALGPSPRPGLPVERHDGPFDDRFDTLWTSVKAAYPAICRRDAALLTWRYLEHPDADQVVLTLEASDRLRGYCVIRAFDRQGRRRGKILDLLTAPDDRPAREALLASAVRELRRLRVERAECFSSGADVGRLLERLGFSPKLSKAGRPGPMLVRHLPESAFGIYVTQGDGDGG
jgi:hypothetical protein